MLATEFDLELLEEIWKKDYREEHFKEAGECIFDLLDAGYSIEDAKELFKEWRDGQNGS